MACRIHLWILYFNSQPHEEADYNPVLFLTFLANFNSQPHEEADGFSVVDGDMKIISTHSLTKRLTAVTTAALQNWRYFNSQPHEEADKQELAGSIPARDFNSQPHEEADSNFRQKYIYLKLFFTLIAHSNLVFLFKLLYCKFFSGKIHTFSGANVLKYFCKLTFRTIILKYL